MIKYNSGAAYANVVNLQFHQASAPGLFEHIGTQFRILIFHDFSKTLLSCIFLSSSTLVIFTKYQWLEIKNIKVIQSFLISRFCVCSIVRRSNAYLFFIHCAWLLSLPCLVFYSFPFHHIFALLCTARPPARPAVRGTFHRRRIFSYTFSVLCIFWLYISARTFLL